MTEKLKEALGDLSNLLSTMTETKSLVHAADYIEFKSTEEKNNINRGLIWSSNGTIKHLVLKADNRISSSESLEISKGRSFIVDGTPVLSETALGSSVVKSNLREVGKLKNLSVDGNLTINNYVFYNGTVDRLGLGIENPNAALSVAEDGIEVVIGTINSSKGMVGTHGCHDLDLVTDSVSRVSIEKNGNIILGNKTYGTVKTSIYGKLYVGMNNLDSRVDLHVDGMIKYQDHIHQYAEAEPISGNYCRGDIVWNSEPDLGKCVGWVCVRAGTPGGWLPFGEIKHK
jgi:hypothetical protein